MEEEFLQRGKMEGNSDITVQLIDEKEREIWNSDSMGITRQDFISRLPDKIKECLNPGNYFQIDGSKSETLVHGEKEYYDKQFETLRLFEEIDALNTSNEINEAQNLEEQRESEFMIKISNYANIVIWALKIYATIISGSIAIAASTFDSLLNLISGGFLGFTYISMRNKIIYQDPIAKLRVQPVGIIIFTAALAILGFEVLVQSFERLTENGTTYKMNSVTFASFYSIMFVVTITKLVLWIYCKNSENKTVHAFSDDHYFDIVINMFSWGVAVLGEEFYWWIDPIGALIIAIYSIFSWSKIVWKTTASLIGQSAPQEIMQKLIYMVMRHHPEIKRVCKLRAYTFGILYFVEVEVQVSEDLPFKETHEIEKSLRLQIEKLPEIERAFVHLHFDSHHYNLVDIQITEELPLEESREIGESSRIKIETETSFHFNSDSNDINNPCLEDVKIPEDLPLKETQGIEETQEVEEDLPLKETQEIEETQEVEEPSQKNVDISELENEFVHVDNKTENFVHINFDPPQDQS